MPVAIQNELNVYESAEARFEIAAQKLGLEEGVYRYLKYPSREVTVYIPALLDSGHLEVFIGYRVLHSQVRGPGKGGIRFAPNVSLDEVRALAAALTGRRASGSARSIAHFFRVAANWAIRERAEAAGPHTACGAAGRTAHRRHGRP